MWRIAAFFILVLPLTFLSVRQVFSQSNLQLGTFNPSPIATPQANPPSTPTTPTPTPPDNIPQLTVPGPTVIIPTDDLPPVPAPSPQQGAYNGTSLTATPVQGSCSDWFVVFDNGFGISPFGGSFTVYLYEEAGEMIAAGNAPNLPIALNQLGCSGGVRGAISVSPLIHVYAPDGQEVNIKLPSAVTFTNHQYSLLNGINMRNGDSLYYELRSSQFAVDSSQGGQVVKGSELRDYLFNNLLPSLDLTEKELTDFIDLDINPQLTNLTCHPDPAAPEKDLMINLEIPLLRQAQDRNDNQCNYEVTLLQNEEVNKLIPLNITPKPDTLIRNLIIVRQSSSFVIASETKQSQKEIATSPSAPRDDDSITIVENGFWLLK